MKLLICKDELSGNLIDVKVLNESENIKYNIIDNAPTIENTANKIGRYEFDDKGEVIVKYIDKPKTQLDLIQDTLNKIISSTITIEEDNLLSVDLAIEQDAKLDIINNKIDNI